MGRRRRGRRGWIIFPSDRLDAQDCHLICAAHNASVAAGERALWCESLVNPAGEPVVQITLGPEVAQLDIRSARLHLAALGEVIEAAMSDAVLVRFMREYVFRGRPGEEAEEAGARLLVMFREFRDVLTGKAPIEEGAAGHSS
jgi:hypothetical protein